MTNNNKFNLRFLFSLPINHPRPLLHERGHAGFAQTHSAQPVLLSQLRHHWAQTKEQIPVQIGGAGGSSPRCTNHLSYSHLPFLTHTDMNNLAWAPVLCIKKIKQAVCRVCCGSALMVALVVSWEVGALHLLFKYLSRCGSIVHSLSQCSRNSSTSLKHGELTSGNSDEKSGSLNW